MPEAIIKLGGLPLYATVSGFYSAGNADIDRGYRNAGNVVQSHGETDVTIAGGKLRLDWLNAFAVGATSFTPYTSVGHVKAKFDGYSETGVASRSAGITAPNEPRPAAWAWTPSIPSARPSTCWRGLKAFTGLTTRAAAQAVS
jgi:hypothetical protein